MKNLLLLLLSLTLCTNFVDAQKISIKKGFAYADDSVYCKVTGKTGFAGSMETSFSITALDDTELIFVNENTEEEIYEFSFLSFNEKIKIAKIVFGSSWKTNIVKELFKNKVIAGNKINETGKNNFILKFKKEEVKNNRNDMRNIDAENNFNTNQLKLVDRDKEAEIFVFGNDIKQDFKLIGTFSSKTAINKNADIIRTYFIKLPGGERIAEFKMNEFKAEDNSLYIFRNDKTISVKGLTGVIAGSDDIMIKVAQLLIENRSL